MTGGVSHNRPRVRGLGYVIVESQRLEEWQRFCTDLLGMQPGAEFGDPAGDRLDFRMDEKEFRLAVRRGDRESLAVVGWEVSGPEELAALEQRLEEAGFDPHRLSRGECRTRRISEAVVVADPDGLYDIELHYGLRDANTPFVSPIGVEFSLGADRGIGHVFQAVSDEDVYKHLYFDTLGFELSDHIEAGDKDLIFTHCNRRHHSFAFAHLPARGVRVGHLMFEVTDMDMLGRAMHKVDLGAAPLRSTFGRHTNDKMLSIYVESPSGFDIEYGFNGRLITDDWVPSRYSKTAYWGHRKLEPQAMPA